MMQMQLEQINGLDVRSAEKVTGVDDGSTGSTVRAVGKDAVALEVTPNTQ